VSRQAARITNPGVANLSECHTFGLSFAKAWASVTRRRPQLAPGFSR
jgi:hypothetical protein